MSILTSPSWFELYLLIYVKLEKSFKKENLGIVGIVKRVRATDGEVW